MHNQKGEVMTGAMVVIMVVLMAFGGVHMMHGGRDHRHDEKSRKGEHKHESQQSEGKDGMHHMHEDGEGHSH